ncbi:hypothetical protein [Yoonia sp. 2307UL14-13]|uniref:hypothetical protein n=1 Tax=Yoonia sp. 2307UL14-13 TaxID=3126506 RepID=UPI0030A0B4DA
MTQTRRYIFAPVFCAVAAGAAAQDIGAPLSAIDWLSQSVEPASAVEPPVARGIVTPPVTMTPLDQPSKDRVGLLPASVTGLPPSIWAGSDEETLVALVQSKRVETLPAIQDFLKVLMLAEADPPAGAGPDGALFLARVDKLLDLGALDQAQALIEEASPDTAPLFRRWFDVALLTGTEDDACDVMADAPAVAPTYAARIFCLARSGDWNTAALTLNTHRVLGDIGPAEEALLSRFLDPELYEDEPALDPPDRISPLVFRMHEAIGEPLITANQPLAFAHADLRSTAPWKAQIEAAERLARVGAVSENVLQRVYTGGTPAASGGIWDRAKAVQAFDAALRARSSKDVTDTLAPVWTAIETARAEVAFAKLYGPALQDITLTGGDADLAFRIGLLSPDYEEVALSAPDGADAFLTALARGVPQEVRVTNSRELAIQAAFNGAQPPPALRALVDEGKLGEALLRAITLFNAGYRGDARSVTDALALFRSVGLEDVARRASLQMLILDRAT